MCGETYKILDQPVASLVPIYYGLYTQLFAYLVSFQTKQKKRCCTGQLRVTSTQVRIIWEEEITAEKMALPDQPVGKSVGL